MKYMYKVCGFGNQESMTLEGHDRQSHKAEYLVTITIIIAARVCEINFTSNDRYCFKLV